MLLNDGLLDPLKKLLTHKEISLRIATCDLISVLASIRGQIQVSDSRSNRVALLHLTFIFSLNSLVLVHLLINFLFDSVEFLVQPLINSGIMEVVIKLINIDEHLRWKFVKVFKYATRGTPSQIRSNTSFSLSLSLSLSL
jgi:hypothetical protein